MNCLPRIIAPTHLAIFSFFYPLPVKLKIEYQQKHGFCYIFSVIVYMHLTFSTTPWILPLKITKSAWYFEIALYISTPRNFKRNFNVGTFSFCFVFLRETGLLQVPRHKCKGYFCIML